MPNTDDATTSAETTTVTTTPKTATKAKRATPAAKDPTKAETAAADKALATFHETGHVPAGWVYSRGVMSKRAEG